MKSILKLLAKKLFLKLMKKIFSNVVLSRIISRYSKGIGSILMFHRVDSLNNNLKCNENLVISSDYLESLIITLKESGYKFISLNDYYEKKNINQKFIIFTFDDGYKDNIINAMPVFKKHNVPFCVYITSSFIDGSAIMWWYILEEIIINNDIVKLNDGSIFACRTEEEKEKAFLEIREKILKIKHDSFRENLVNMFECYDIDPYKYVKRLALNDKDIMNLVKEPLVTLGYHTRSHFAMNNLDDNMLYDEVVCGKEEFEKRFNIKLEHFAYPFGTRNEVGKREFDFIKQLNMFKTSTTTRLGNISYWNYNHLEALPRIFVKENDNILERINFDTLIVNKLRRKIKY